jgi:hypothetical protein
MKTSDKLILFFSLSVLGLYGAAQLALYARSRQGEIVTNAPLEEGRITEYKGKAPAFLSLQGNVNVRLIPSDTFYIEYEREAKGKINCRPFGTDSLLVQGEDLSRMSPHRPFQGYSDFPWIEVHTGTHTRIRLTGVLAIVKGPTNSGRTDWDLQAINTQLWIGEAYGNETDFAAAELYDSVQVNATNTNIVLNRNAVIGQLTAQLDDQSEINDEHATIGKPAIHYTDRSKVNLTGINLNKLRQKGTQ